MKLKFLLILFLLKFDITTVFAQREYYDPIDGVQGGAILKTALHNLVKEHSVIKYGSGTSSSGEYRTWGAFYLTDYIIDENGNRCVFDMYSSTKRFFGERGESVSGMHIEHSLPKSWWTGADELEKPYSDLHHLRPSDGNANLKKSNHPLAELARVTWTNGVSSVGKMMLDGDSITAFEPSDEYKGDFARMYMYMFTCYQDLAWEHTCMNYSNSAYPTLKPWAVELLLKWHRQDPVCEGEVKRNNEVYGIQGNRNPYIDYPQLADYVWGDSVGYVFNVTTDVEDGVSSVTGITAIATLKNGDNAMVKGVAVAVNTRSFLLEDETKRILVYLGIDPEVEVGDEVFVSGVVESYSGMLQFSKSSFVEKTGKSVEVAYPDAVVLDGSAMDRYLDAPDIMYVEYAGTLIKSNGYYNVIVDDAETAVGSISYPTEELVAFSNGEKIKVTGYTTGVSGGVYINTIVVSVCKEDNVVADTEIVTDLLDRSLTGITANAYKEWNGKRANSDAVYSGISAGSNESIQLRSDNSTTSSGIVTTVSGGKVKKITVEWNAKTVAGRTLDVYGKSEAYTSTADLYDPEEQGSKLGSIVCGTTTELEVDGDYRYIGLRSQGGAMYLLSIEIAWQMAVDEESDDDGTLSVKESSCDADMMPSVFDLSGRQLSNMAAPGFYIVNGKKIVSK